MKKLIVAIFLLSGFSALAVTHDDAHKYFDIGCQLYEEEQFNEALDTFLLVLEGYQSYELHYNLGNTYYRLEQLGPAILHYEKAKRINPYDEDLITNLQIANLQTDKIESIPTLGVQDLWDNLTSKGMLWWWTIIAITGCFIGFSLLIAFIYSRNRNYRRIYFFTAILSLFVAASSMGMGVSTKSIMNAAREAVIFSPKVDVTNAPNGSQIEFVLHEGSKIRIRRIEGEWLEIRISNGSVGWIHESACEVI
jgi:tetratricopeptide (TPR) repeat protein